jgi:L,D-transpeptidase YcbB
MMAASTPFRRLLHGAARTALAGAILAATGLTAGAAPARPHGSDDRLADLIQVRIAAPGARGAPVIVIGGERIHAATGLPRFYHGREYRAAWVNELGPRAVADSAVRAIENAAREGLESGDYHLAQIQEILGEVRRAQNAGRRPDPERLADLDLLLTDAFLVLASHLSSGRVDPTTIHPEWSARPGTVDPIGELDMALATGRVGERLEGLVPSHPAYLRLRATLADYRWIAELGGWPELPGRTLAPGMRDPAVALLRERLRMTGDLDSSRRARDEQLYDADVEAAVRRAQERHALDVTGVLGLETSGALNVPVEDRIRQLELNMERWRWLPRDLGAQHIVVNIAGMEMHVMHDDLSVFHSRVLVGQRYRRTPVFSDRMTYLVLNPTWTIPPGILEEDKLPLIREDVRYLARNNITILDARGRAVDPSTIDFNRLTGRTGYRFRMDPGPENPLGQVKFMFPNQYHVYLHDTPDHEDFDLPGGAISSGCIRVERSMDLAEFLLDGTQGWSRQAIEREIRRASGETTIRLPTPIPIHILYWTAWVDRHGAAHFRRDVYERDGPLEAALRKPAPAAVAGPR